MGIESRAGMHVSLSDGCLEIGERSVIALSGARRWSGSVAACTERVRDSAVISFLRSSICEHAGFAGFGTLVAPGEKDHFARRADTLLRAATARPDSMDLSGLIGLGIGLTPSGDDFLTGALAAEAVVGQNPRSASAGRIDRSALSAGIHKRSLSGRTLLSAALEGQFPLYLLRITEALCCAGADREQRIYGAVKEAADHGATSGIDTCVGVWWYLTQTVSG